MAIILTDNVHVNLGETVNNNEELATIKKVVYKWKPDDGYDPALTLNNINPIDFPDPHKWVLGEFHCLAEEFEAFYHNGSGNKVYIVPNGRNVSIPYAVVTAEDAAGQVWKYTFVGLKPWMDAGEIEVDKEVVHVYPFVAKYVTKEKVV